MPILFTIRRKLTKKVVRDFMAFRRRVALLKDGTVKPLGHPCEDQDIYDLEEEGVFDKEILEDLVYDKEKDEFLYWEEGKERPDNIVDLKEATDYEMSFGGIS